MYGGRGPFSMLGQVSAVLSLGVLWKSWLTSCGDVFDLYTSSVRKQAGATHQEMKMPLKKS